MIRFYALSLLIFSVLVVSCSKPGAETVSSTESAKEPAAAAFTVQALEADGRCTEAFVQLFNDFVLNRMGALIGSRYPDRVEPINEAIRELDRFQKHYAGVKCKVEDGEIDITKEIESFLVSLRQTAKEDAGKPRLCPKEFMDEWRPIVKELIEHMTAEIGGEGRLSDEAKKKNQELTDRVAKLKAKYPDLFCLLKDESMKPNENGYFYSEFNAEEQYVKAESTLGTIRARR